MKLSSEFYYKLGLNMLLTDENGCWAADLSAVFASDLVKGQE